MPLDGRIYAGLDWGSQSHYVWVTDAEGTALGERVFPHSGAGLTALAAWVQTWSAHGAQVIVAVELSRGAVVETLLASGCHVWGINPKQVDRFRDRYTVAGAKDDRRDARVLAEAARTDPQAFRVLEPADPVTAQLQECSRHDEELGDDAVRLCNRLRDLLQRTWPELLQLSPAADEPWLWVLLARAPTPAAAAALRPVWLRQLLRRHRIRRFTADDVRRVLRTPSVYVTPGTREGVTARIRDLIIQLEVVHRQRGLTHRQLVALLEQLRTPSPSDRCREHPDAEILQSLPGIGTRIAGTMLAEAADALRRRDYHALRAHTGIAPVTRQSGKSRVVQMRYACNHRLQRAVYCWAQTARCRDPYTRAHYQRLRAAGHNHARAQRGIIDRLLRILIVLLATDTLYDAARRGAPRAA